MQAHLSSQHDKFTAALSSQSCRNKDVAAATNLNPALGTKHAPATATHPAGTWHNTPNPPNSSAPSSGFSPCFTYLEVQQQPPARPATELPRSLLHTPARHKSRLAACIAGRTAPLQQPCSIACGCKPSPRHEAPLTTPCIVRSTRSRGASPPSLPAATTAGAPCRHPCRCRLLLLLLLTLELSSDCSTAAFVQLSFL